MKINEIFNWAMDTQYFIVSGSHYEMITPLSLGTVLPHVRLSILLFSLCCTINEIFNFFFLTQSFQNLVCISPFFFSKGRISTATCSQHTGQPGSGAAPLRIGS